MKLSVLVRLKEYLAQEDKNYVEKIVRKQENTMIEQIKNKPFDTVHAMNFMIMHKESTNNELYLHSIEVLNNSDYQIMEAVLPKIAPLITKSKCDST